MTHRVCCWLPASRSLPDVPRHPTIRADDMQQVLPPSAFAATMAARDHETFIGFPLRMQCSSRVTSGREQVATA
jgi:hypothetical protein